MRCPKCKESIDQAAIKSLEECDVTPNQNSNVEFDCEYCKTEIHGKVHVEMVVKVEEKICPICEGTKISKPGLEHMDLTEGEPCPKCVPLGEILKAIFARS